MKQIEQYFSYDPDDGFETFATEEEAKENALAIIEAYREGAGDGWADEVEQVCYGRIIGRTVEKRIPPQMPLCSDSKFFCIECPRGENHCNPLITFPCENYDYSNDGEEHTDYGLEMISGEWNKIEEEETS